MHLQVRAAVLNGEFNALVGPGTVSHALASLPRLFLGVGAARLGPESRFAIDVLDVAALPPSDAVSLRCSGSRTETPRLANSDHFRVTFTDNGQKASILRFRNHLPA